MIWFRRAAVLILLLLILVIGLAAWLTMTHGGMQRLFSLGKSYAQGELNWGESSGTLAGPAAIEDLLYVNDAGVSVQIDSTRFDWQPRKLLSRELNIQELDISGVTLRLPAAESAAENPKAPPFQLQDLALPVATNLRKVSISDLAIYTAGNETPVIIDRILLSADGEDDALSIVDLVVTAPQGEFRLDGNVNTSGQWPLSLSNQWNFDHPQLGMLNGAGMITGFLDELQVSHRVEGSGESGLIVVVDAIVNDAVAEPRWDVEVTVSADDLGVLNSSLNEVPVNLKIDTSGTRRQYQATGKLDAEHPGSGSVSSEFLISGNSEVLGIDSLDINFADSSAAINLQGIVELASLDSELEVNWREVNVPLAATPPVVRSSAGVARFNGTPDTFSASIETEVVQEQTGPLKVRGELSGANGKLNVNSLFIESEDGTTRLNASGVVDSGSQQLEAQGQWTNLQWPLAGAPPQIRSPAGKFSALGSFSDYQISATADIEQGKVPAGSWELSARGNTGKLENIVLEGETLGGVIAVSGEAGWSPQPFWQLALKGNQINPALQWKNRDGKIGFAADINGTVEDNGPVIDATLAAITGHYRQQKLNGKGGFLMRNGEVVLNGVEVAAGKARFRGDGRIGDSLDLQWQVSAPSLGSLDSSMSGSLEAAGRAGGTLEMPTAEFDLSLGEFSANEMQAGVLSASGTIDATGQTESIVAIEASDVVVAGQKLYQLRVDGSGTPQQHTLDVEIAGDLADVKLGGSGGVNSGQWQGTIERLSLLKTEFGDWKLQQPAPVVVSANTAEARRFCMESAPTLVCTRTKWNGSDGMVANLELSELHARRFIDFLPPDIVIDAALNGTADMKIGADGELQANAAMVIPQGTVSYEDRGEPVTASLGESVINARIANDQLSSEVELDLGKIGVLSASTVVAGLSAAQRLSGNVQSQLQDLSLLGIALPQLQAIDGMLYSDLKLSGTLSSPVVDGEARVEKFVTEIPSMALKITDGSISATGDGQGRLAIDGSLRSGDGTLDLQGMVEPEAGRVNLAIKGKQFQVANTEKQQVTLTPDLQLKIDNGDVSVSGDVLIPSAFIDAGGGSETISESEDVVIIEADGAEPQKDRTSRVSLSVNVKLGDDIRVSAGQFDGALSGGVLVEQLPGRVATGSGAIDVVNGDFLVYGQKLTMEKGRILFGGGPLDDPALELDVARDVATYNVKAGARIRGTAQSPILELQSDPPQTDANTLSYIVLGKPVGTLGASYTLGKFITPDIYVSYGIDLFDKIRTFNLRYKITDRLSLNAANSKKSSADLVYTIER